MRSTRRSWLVWVVGSVVVAAALIGAPFAAVAASVKPLSGELAPTLRLAASPLAGPSIEELLSDEGARAMRAARRDTPAAIAERRRSLSQYEGLSIARAEGEASRAFPALTGRPTGVIPLAAGERIGRYLTDHAAQVSLPGGNVLIEAAAPIASRGAHGRLLPFDLNLTNTGTNFAPVRSHVTLRVPHKLSEGVSLPSVGVSLTPVDARGHALRASEGTVKGAAVLWAGTQGAAVGEQDLTTVATATSAGFDLSTVLLSQRSPGRLYYRIGIPAGARLQREDDGSVRVLRRATLLATILPVSAQDAEGSNVPVSIAIQASTLLVNVDRDGDYLYPIAVDPEVNDGQLAQTTAGKRSNWEFHSSNLSRFQGTAVYEGAGVEHLETRGIAEYGPTEWAYWGYQTKGVSHIYEAKTETSAKNKNAKIESFLEFEEPGGAQETKKLLSTEGENPEYEHKAATLCAANASKTEECLPGSGKAKNAVHFQQSATAAPGGNYHFSDTMSQGIVSIAEPAGTHSTTGYNTTSPTFEFELESEGKKEKVKRANVLYSTGSWLSKSAGALQLNASDPGIGVAATKLEYESSAGKWSQLVEHNYLEAEHACQGVQCYETHSEYWTLPVSLPNGEQKLRYTAEEAMPGTKSLESEGQATVKVDSAPPHNVEINGLPFGDELSEKPYALTIEATDGEGAVASSGIKSIALFVDGHEVGTPSGSCSIPKGECTASAKWTVNGAELGSGKHDITVVALDNAGNETRIYEPVSIRHSTPVALGPGSVDLQSGDFSLSATDVSLGAGLTVSRSYSSRAPFAGAAGPLGPQWSIGLSSTDSLAELVNGSVMMTAANGSQSIFAVLGEGKFESPAGDSNLELSLEENKTTKQKLAYYLKDSAAHTSVKFTRPGSSTLWVPSKQEGTVANQTVTFSYRAAEQYTEYNLPSESRPQGMVTGADGNLWFTLSGANKIVKMTPTGKITEYPTTFKKPRDLTAGADGSVWFTGGELSSETDYITRITPSGAMRSFGIPSGDKAIDVASGPDGNLWFVGIGVSTTSIGKMTTSGAVTEYPLPTGCEPNAIAAGPDGDIWFTDHNRSKIMKMTTTGTIAAEYALPAGSGPSAITAGSEGKLWFTDTSSNKIGKITTTGVATEYSLPSGATASSKIVAAADGSMWFTTSGGTTKLGRITAAGTVTEYTLPPNALKGLIAGPEGNLWFTGEYPSKVGMVPISGASIEPTEVLAPKPAGVSCEPELKRGCRALKFNYSSETTATGEAEGGWGHFKATLSSVVLVAYDPSSKSMKETTVAEYLYDNRDRLRAEWDPRTSPSLKTYYGYDQEGHLTVALPPGQEPWGFTYGTAAGDKGTGRLLKAQRAPASAELWKTGFGFELNTERPVVTGTLAEGVRLAASNGIWSNGTFNYAYQWKDCNSEGESCQSIPGATNPNYTLGAGDLGHTIVAAVTATSDGGSATAESYASAVVNAAHSTPFTEYPIPNGSAPSGIAAGPDANLWFLDEETAKAGKITPAGAVTEYWSNPHKYKDLPRAITTGPDGNLWYVSYYSNAVFRMTTSGTATEFPLTRSATYNTGVAAGSDGNIWFTESGPDYIGKMTTSGVVSAEYSLPAGSDPRGIVAGPDGNLWFTEQSTSKIGKITTAGAITEYALPTGSYPIGIAVGSDGNLWFACSEKNKIGKITTSGAITEYVLPAGSRPREITAGPDGKLWFTEAGTAKIGQITTSGVVTEYSLGHESEPQAITAGPDGNVWYTDHRTNKIVKIALVGSTQSGEPIAPQPGVTLEYNVPVSGAGAPYNMSKAEVARWGQKDIPGEATAIFAPDEPQGWPASGYTRASIHYLDDQGREVNVATPGGGIATSEYNEYNDVIRSLSADDRAAALAAGESSAERSKLLDTQSTYNGEGAKEGEVAEPGTLLISTLGPQHEVKYVAGKEQKESLAREHKEFFYDQGAPGGEKYRLLTETADLAQLTNHEEVEVRATRNSYSGQSNLGWKLRAPTSVTVDPEGLKLTSTTEYNPTTGQVTETRGAGAESTLSYATKFGEGGTEAGKLKSPAGVAVSSEGKLWVVDSANDRIEEFGPEGAFVRAFGEAGAGAGQLSSPQGIALDGAGHIWVADTANNRVEEFSSVGAYIRTVGSLGSGTGEFKVPSALAFDPKGNLWVADTGNSRIEKFDSEGKYLSQFGSPGSEPALLAEPMGIAVDGSEDIWVADTGNNRIEEFSKTGSFIRRVGSPGAGEGQLDKPLGVAVDSVGNVWVADSLNARAESFTPTGAFVTQIGWQGSEAGQLNGPRALAFDAAGKLWVTDSSNNRLEQWSKGPNARDRKTVYYSAEANTEGYAACGSHPEWSGLVCETLPAKQPELFSLPKLPVATYKYNMYDESEVSTETFGTTTRTTKTTYDAVGRRQSSETTASTGHALPKITFSYNKELGLLEKQTAEGEEHALSYEYNRLGQLTTYTDGDANVTKYKYFGPEDDFQLQEYADSSNAGASHQTYTYDPTTKLRTQLNDSAAGTFTASYDAEGNLASIAYPYNICENYTRNSVNELTALEYEKTTGSCTGGTGAWYTDAAISSVHGEMLGQTSTLASASYAYDTAGRLIEGQETPVGAGCTTRGYAYDPEGDRASSTTRAPGVGGVCVNEGGTAEAHNYDEGNRLADGGMAYDGLGNITTLPPADAEGHELTTSYYVDNAVASQSQNGITSSYFLDPEGRVRETVTGTASTISHYDAPGQAVAWTSQGAGWTRNIPGFGGALLATQANGETPILQLHDLQGNVVATIGDKSGETKLLSTYASTEFGVPNGGKAPPKFAWLGAIGVESSLPSGVITYGATSYVPQTGRTLQSEAVQAPGLPEGTGAGGAYTSQEEPWNMQGAAREGAEAPGLEAAREQAAEEAAIRAAIAAGGEDPSELLSLADARIKGEQLLTIGSWAEVIGFLGSIPSDLGDLIAGEIGEKVAGLEGALDWFHKAGQKLVQCSHTYAEGYRRCLFKYNDISVLGVKFVEVWSSPEVEKCAPPWFHLSGQPWIWRCERLNQ